MSIIIQIFVIRCIGLFYSEIYLFTNIEISLTWVYKCWGIWIRFWRVNTFNYCLHHVCEKSKVQYCCFIARSAISLHLMKRKTVKSHLLIFHKHSRWPISIEIGSLCFNCTENCFISDAHCTTSLNKMN